MELLPIAVYGLCLLTSGACAALLMRAWRRTGSRLLLWTATSFCFLTLNNLALVADMVLFPAVDLWLLRFLATVVAISLLLFGFVWESDGGRS